MTAVWDWIVSVHAWVIEKIAAYPAVTLYVGLALIVLVIVF